jgi:hypothetical protein
MNIVVQNGLGVRHLLVIILRAHAQGVVAGTNCTNASRPILVEQIARTRPILVEIQTTSLLLASSGDLPLLTNAKSKTTFGAIPFGSSGRNISKAYTFQMKPFFFALDYESALNKS